MLEVKESSVRLYFASILRESPSREVLGKLFAWRILSVIFLPFTHNIYTLITYKSKRGYFREKTLDRFLQHNTLIILERATHPLVRNHCILFSLRSPIVIS